MVNIFWAMANGSISTQQAAIGLFAASALATTFINHNTNSHLKRVVMTHNTSMVHHSLRLRPTAMGLAASPTGQPLLALHWALR